MSSGECRMCIVYAVDMVAVGVLLERLGVVVCACNLTTWRPGGRNRRRWDLRPSSAHVDRASALSTASIWGSHRKVRTPGRLRRSAPGQGGNPAAKSSHVVQ